MNTYPKSFEGLTVEEIIKSIKQDIEESDIDDCKFTIQDYMNIAESYVYMLEHRKKPPYKYRLGNIEFSIEADTKEEANKRFREEAVKTGIVKYCPICGELTSTQVIDIQNMCAVCRGKKE